MNKLSKRINLVANLAIALVVILIALVFAKNYLLAPHPTAGAEDYRIPVGTKISLSGIDWAKNGQTLLLVLRKGCRFCEESAPFYRRLALEAATNKSRVRIVAVLPQEVDESKQYLSSLGVPIDEVRQSALDVLGVQGTPTVILVNAQGEVQVSWAGKLPAAQETEVLNRIENNSSTVVGKNRLLDR
jgi:thioredoxin-related protein